MRKCNRDVWNCYFNCPFGINGYLFVKIINCQLLVWKLIFYIYRLIWKKNLIDQTGSLNEIEFRWDFRCYREGVALQLIPCFRKDGWFPSSSTAFTLTLLSVEMRGTTLAIWENIEAVTSVKLFHNDKKRSIFLLFQSFHLCSFVSTHWFLPFLLLTCRIYTNTLHLNLKFIELNGA